jgi:hypothetical protein
VIERRLQRVGVASELQSPENFQSVIWLNASDKKSRRSGGPQRSGLIGIALDVSSRRTSIPTAIELALIKCNLANSSEYSRLVKRHRRPKERGVYGPETILSRSARRGFGSPRRKAMLR